MKVSLCHSESCLNYKRDDNDRTDVLMSVLVVYVCLLNCCQHASTQVVTRLYNPLYYTKYCTPRYRNKQNLDFQRNKEGEIEKKTITVNKH